MDNDELWYQSAGFIFKHLGTWGATRHQGKFAKLGEKAKATIRQEGYFGPQTQETIREGIALLQQLSGKVVSDVHQQAMAALGKTSALRALADPTFGSTRERESRYNSPTLRYGDCPGSLGATVYGLNDTYGGHPVIDEIKRLNDLVMDILKGYVKAYQVGKISKLMSLSNQRDKLIKGGAPSNAPQVLAIDDQARGLVNPSPDDDRVLQKIAWERDDLLREAVQQGIQV
jgi:hypothetical protein